MKEDINPVLLQVFRSVVWVYSVITFLPWYFFSGTGSNLERARRIKAYSVSGHPAGPYRAINSQEKLVALMEPGVNTLDKMFEYAARRFPMRDCLGTREVLSEEDELQPNGKVFKKVRAFNLLCFVDILNTAFFWSEFCKGVVPDPWDSWYQGTEGKKDTTYIISVLFIVWFWWKLFFRKLSGSSTTSDSFLTHVKSLSRLLRLLNWNPQADKGSKR